MQVFVVGVRLPAESEQQELDPDQNPAEHRAEDGRENKQNDHGAERAEDDVADRRLVYGLFDDPDDYRLLLKEKEHRFQFTALPAPAPCGPRPALICRLLARDCVRPGQGLLVLEHGIAESLRDLLPVRVRFEQRPFLLVRQE